MTVDVTTLHAPILVRRLEDKETAKGDIITIPDTAKKKPQEDEVLGPARRKSGRPDFVGHTDRRRGVSSHPRGGTPRNAHPNRQRGIRQ